ncbi:MAG: hypothetical protein R2792_09400 [Saprospiraceae bacterium]
MHGQMVLIARISVALLPGTYTVTVTDANGCTSSTSVVVLNSNSPQLTTVVTDATCGANNGSID